MIFYYEYLQDKEFLKKVDTYLKKDVYVKIDILDMEENFIESLSGRATQGNINIQAKSPMRRTGSITFVLDQRTSENNDVDGLLSLNKKIALELGYKNTTNEYLQYDIIWFPLGIYLISGKSIANNAQGLVASLQLKDKMATLNGDIGGTLPAAIELSKVDTIDVNGNQITQEDTIYQIIYQLVNHMGLEDRAKILVDLPTKIKYLQQWSPENDSTHSLAFIQNPDNVKQYSIIMTESQPNRKENIFGQKECCGYVYTDFTWPNKNPLTSRAGESIANQLEKIVKTLSNYEFFYDLNGTFIFQEVQNYLNTTKATTILNQYQDGIDEKSYVLNYAAGAPVYNFNDSNIIISYQNAPQYENIKNDFIVWGKRKNTNTPVRYHLAIDSKPPIGDTVKVIKYWDDQNQMWKFKKPFIFNSKSEFPTIGAAEVFYYAADEGITYCWNKKNEKDQMPQYLTVTKRIIEIKRNQQKLIKKQGKRVYYQYEKDSSLWQFNGEEIVPYQSAEGDDIRQRIRKEISLDTIYYFNSSSGKKCFKYSKVSKGFVQVDNNEIDKIILSQDTELSTQAIYKITADDEQRYFMINQEGTISQSNNLDSLNNIAAQLMEISLKDWRTVLYLQGAVASATGIDSNYYYTELESEWTNIYDVENQSWKIKKETSYDDLNWYLDLIDSDADISKYSVKSIGRRAKIIQDDNVNCVFEPEIPDFIIIEEGNLQDLKECQKRGETYAIAPKEIFKDLVGSKGYNSAFEAVRDLLYQHTVMNEQITIQALPIYHLDANQVISVTDNQSGINGEYLIQSISLPLDVNGVMSITATKLLEKI